MNLIDATDLINKSFKQEYVLLDQWDYKLEQFVLRKNPKFLFRGEDSLYPSMMSTYHRMAFMTNPTKTELFYYMSDLSAKLIGRFSRVVPKSDVGYKPLLNQAHAVMQHYGFPIRWLDFTENSAIAAFFASHLNTSGKGRIWVISLQQIITAGAEFYRLSDSFAIRSKIQQGWALNMEDEMPNLREIKKYTLKEVNFNVTKNDINFFGNPKLLSTLNDLVSDFIINYLTIINVVNENVKYIFSRIKDNLINDRK